MADLADPHQNEKMAARGLVAELPVGSLLFADLGDFGFAWFDARTDAASWGGSRRRATTSCTIIHTLSPQGDTRATIGWLGAHRADRARQAVRLVQCRHGGTRYRYVTNVLDPPVPPLADIARLYARRGDIARAGTLSKTHLGLQLLWGAKPVMVRQQVWAVFTSAQVLHARRLAIAGRAGVTPAAVSLPLLVESRPSCAYRGLDPLAVFVAPGRALRCIRPASRTPIVAPAIPPAARTAPPPALARERPPRHARRKCGPRTPAA